MHLDFSLVPPRLHFLCPLPKEERGTNALRSTWRNVASSLLTWLSKLDVRMHDRTSFAAEMSRGRIRVRIRREARARRAGRGASRSVCPAGGISEAAAPPGEAGSAARAPASSALHCRLGSLPGREHSHHTRYPPIKLSDD